MIDKETSLSEALKHGKRCTDQCGHCCRYGTGALVDDDSKHIAKFLGITEEDLHEQYLEDIEKFNTKLKRPKIIPQKEGLPYGRCVFLDDGYGCTIHPVKPLQCRVGTCAEIGEDLSLWFTLNFFVNPDDPESIRQFAAYLRVGGKTLDKGKLYNLVQDKVRLKKILQYGDLIR